MLNLKLSSLNASYLHPKTSDRLKYSNNENILDLTTHLYTFMKIGSTIIKL